MMPCAPAVTIVKAGAVATFVPDVTLSFWNADTAATSSGAATSTPVHATVYACEAADGWVIV
jgi:hypothetical protein